MKLISWMLLMVARRAFLLEGPIFVLLAKVQEQNQVLAKRNVGLALVQVTKQSDRALS